MLAGARSEIMTLWSVNGDETFEIMQDFLEGFAHGEDRLAALREARLKMRSKKSHPYYWAGIYFMGDPRPMPHN